MTRTTLVAATIASESAGAATTQKRSAPVNDHLVDGLPAGAGKKY
jgi:hypothetical protein